MNDLIIPLKDGNKICFPIMSEQDYELLLATLVLWKERIIKTPKNKRKKKI